MSAAYRPVGIQKATLLEGCGGVFDKLNDEQWEAVLCADNAVTEAGAGSGKTYVLACRYVYKVLTGTPVERILTLTFTNKAVAEMYSRIYGFLVTVAEKGSGAYPVQAKKGVAAFTDARIQTLDSYCATILRRSANRFGIAPDFVVDDPGCRTLAERAALPFLLRHRNNSALQQLFTLEKPEHLALSLFARTAYELPADWGQGNGRGRTFQAQLAEVTREWERLAPEVSALAEELSEGDSAGCDGNDGLALLEAAMKCAKIRKNKANGEALENLRSLIPVFSSVVVFLAQQETLKEVFRLMEDFHAAFQEQKQEAGIVTFADVNRLALRTLQEEEDILTEEQGAYDAIMIDEFQDNNKLQRDLLFLISALSPGKLFFVGDEKQSIYRFRGADVSVFRTLSRDLEAAGTGKRLRLATNYRSAPELIECFNALFGGNGTGAGVFLRGSDVPNYEATYGEVMPNLEQDQKPLLSPKFEIHLLEEDEEGDAALDKNDKKEAEAAFAAQKIRDLHDKEGVPYGDMAILLRARTPLWAFEKHLLRRGIPYGSKKAGDFFADAPVNDLLRILRLLVYPTDADAYAAVLRSPLVGLSYAALMRVLADPVTTASLKDGAPFPALSGAETLLSAEGSACYDRGREIYLDLKEKSRVMGAAALLCEVWYARGYRYECLWSNEVQPYKDLYDYLFEIARQRDEAGEGLPGFVDYLSHLQAEGGKPEELRVVLERPPAVQIMSIHDSKGLEFPVVFLCNAGAKGKNELSEVVYCKGDTVAVKPPLPPELFGREKVNTSVKLKHNYFFEKMRTVEQSQAAAELRRLLYVALTRAERRVYVTGGAKYEKDSFLALLLPALDTSRRDAIPECNHLGSPTTPLLAGIVDAAANSPVGSFITMNAIPLEDTSSLPSAPGTAVTKAQVKDALAPLYAAAQVIETPVVLPTHVAATALAEISQEEALKDFFMLTNIMVTGKSDTVINTGIGEITVDLGETGKSGYGIKHIIEGRYNKDKMEDSDVAALLYLVVQSARSGVNIPELIKGDNKYALEKNGIIAIVSKNRQGKEERFVITGYGFHDKEKEATDAIRTVNAHYGYTPEYSDFRKQVGAVIASLRPLLHRKDGKSSDSAEMPEKSGKMQVHNAPPLSAADFGTAAHACVEALLGGRALALPGRIAVGLSPEDAAAVLADCAALAEGFLASDLGKMAACDPARKSEWEFRSLRGGLFINGTIDLLFVAEGTAYVVDFKTDTAEVPEAHREQLRCYHDAARYLTGLPCRAFIYYLRSGRAVQVIGA